MRYRYWTQPSGRGASLFMDNALVVKKPKEPKRHHVVPDFYLRRFADDAGKITAVHVDVEDRKFTTSTKNVGVETLFYALPTDQGWDYTIEHQLSLLEDAAAVDIEKLASNVRPSTMPAFRKRLSRFLAVQFIRGRRPREQMVQFFKELNLKMLQISTPEIFQAEAARRGETVTIEEARGIIDHARRPDFTFEIPKVGPKELPGESLIHAPDLFREGEQLIPFFFERGWTIVDFDGPLLLTSDEPVVITLDGRTPNHPAGVANAETILFPLDPRTALLLTRPDLNAKHMRRRGTIVEAKAINQFTAFRGAKQLFHHPDSDPLAPLGAPFDPLASSRSDRG
jgi:hypothetical protein